MFKIHDCEALEEEAPQIRNSEKFKKDRRFLHFDIAKIRKWLLYLKQLEIKSHFYFVSFNHLQCV